MKFFGFILVVLSSAVCGVCYCSAKSERLEDLRSFCLMLEMMQGELKDRLSPLPELAQNLSSRLQGKGGTFLSVLLLNLNFLGQKNFENIWCESLKACKPALNREELDSLARLGKVLGRYNVQTQNEALSETLSVIKAGFDKEHEELPQFKKLSVGVSLSVGALLAIMLV